MGPRKILLDSHDIWYLNQKLRQKGASSEKKPWFVEGCWRVFWFFRAGGEKIMEILMSFEEVFFFQSHDSMIIRVCRNLKLSEFGLMEQQWTKVHPPCLKLIARFQKTSKRWLFGISEPTTASPSKKTGFFRPPKRNIHRHLNQLPQFSGANWC